MNKPCISITRNKKRIPLLSLLNKSISSKSASQILSLNDEWLFRSLNFQLLIALCDSFANFSFGIF